MANACGPLCVVLQTSALDREPFHAARISSNAEQPLFEETLRLVNRQVVALGPARAEVPDGSAGAKADPFVGWTDARFPTGRGLLAAAIRVVGRSAAYLYERLGIEGCGWRKRAALGRKSSPRPAASPTPGCGAVHEPMPCASCSASPAAWRSASGRRRPGRRSEPTPPEGRIRGARRPGSPCRRGGGPRHCDLIRPAAGFRRGGHEALQLRLQDSGGSRAEIRQLNAARKGLQEFFSRISGRDRRRLHFLSPGRHRTARRPRGSRSAFASIPPRATPAAVDRNQGDDFCRLDQRSVGLA